MENIESRVDIRLVTNEDQARKLISKPNFQHRTIFSEDLTAIHMKKTKLLFNKPVYLGMRILDLSRTLMYDFHYNYVKPKYCERAKLVFTDTDSLMYEIETEDFYRDISSDVHKKFDTSNFAKDHKSVIPTGVNKKVIGMMKDEAGGKQITEFVGLRSKLYSFKIEEKDEKKCKAVKKSEVKRTINVKDYKDCLFTGNKQMRSMNVIRSHKHEVFSETINKVALSSEDRIRWKLCVFRHNLKFFAHESSSRVRLCLRLCLRLDLRIAINNLRLVDQLRQHFLINHKSQDSKLGLLLAFFLLPHLLLGRRET